MEAMRYAKPLLASDLAGSGVTYVARNGQNAMLVPAEDVLAWRGALEFLHRHPAQRTLMGRLGRERYEREFDIRAISRKITKLYDLARRVELETAAARAAEHRRSSRCATCVFRLLPTHREVRLLAEWRHWSFGEVEQCAAIPRRCPSFGFGRLFALDYWT